MRRSFVLTMGMAGALIVSGAAAGEQVEWTEAEREALHTSCVQAAAADEAFSPAQVEAYCDCSLERVESEFPEAVPTVEQLNPRLDEFREHCLAQATGGAD